MPFKYKKLGKDKLIRFAAIATFPNVVELDTAHKGKWGENFFRNDQPLVLELGCGRGEYTVSMGRFFPEKNFIGVDIKGSRIWKGAKTALEEEIPNIGFLRTQIEQIAEHFGEEEVSEIWITFPDPRPQISRIRKRLTAPRFIHSYQRILKPGGIIHLKTDNDGLYQYTLEVIASEGLKLIKHTHDLYQSDLPDEVLSIQTTYEKIYRDQGKNINYIQFGF